MKNQKNVIFICNNDIFFTLPTIYSLKKNEKLLNIKIDKIIISKYIDKNTSTIKRLKLVNDLGNVFQTLLFIIYLIVRRIVHLLNGVISYKHLAKKYDTELHVVDSIKSVGLEKIEELSKSVEFGLIMVDEIIDKSFIDKFGKLLINKHSSMLPEGKGLYPYVRIFTNNLVPGVSFHEVNEKLDSGKVFFQEEIDKSLTSSLVNFYNYIFSNYYIYLDKCIKNIDNNISVDNEYKSSYFSIPNKKTTQLFKNTGGKLIKFEDFFNLLN